MFSLRLGFMLSPLLLMLGSAAANAAIKDVYYTDKILKPAAGQCGISKMALVVYDTEYVDRFGQKGYTRNSGLSASITTSDPSCTGEYGFVQFIRGCSIAVTYDAKTNEVKAKTIAVRRDWRGKDVPFKHKDWVVDSTEIDPIYTSEAVNSGYGRADMMFADLVPIATKNDRKYLLSIHDRLMSSQKLYKSLQGVASQLRVMDSPDGALSNVPEPGDSIYTVKNASMEFKMCAYHLKDIPTSGDPAFPGTPENAGGPVVCLDWSNKYTFDPAIQNFNHVSTPGVDPFCTKN